MMSDISGSGSSSARRPSTENHLAAFSYLSDEFPFGTALATGLKAAGKGFRNVAMGVSLTHTVSFHDPQARIDGWLVLERETSWGADGRVVIH